MFERAVIARVNTLPSGSPQSNQPTARYNAVIHFPLLLRWAATTRARMRNDRAPHIPFTDVEFKANGYDGIVGACSAEPERSVLHPVIEGSFSRLTSQLPVMTERFMRTIRAPFADWLLGSPKASAQAAVKFSKDIRPILVPDSMISRRDNLPVRNCGAGLGTLDKL